MVLLRPSSERLASHSPLCDDGPVQEDHEAAHAAGPQVDSVKQAWTLRNSEPRLALAAVTHALAGQVAGEDRLMALAAKAAALLAIDDTGAARGVLDEVLDLIEALAGEPALEADGGVAERRTGDGSYRGPPAIDPGRLRSTTAEVAVEAALTGLRSAYLDSDAEAAVPLGRFALEVASHHGLVRLSARAHNELAAVYGAREFKERAMFHLRSGIELLEQNGESVSPALLNNLGNIYLEGERLDEALACFERGRASFAEAQDEFGGAIAESNVGRVLVRLGRSHEGLAALESALETFERLGRRAYVGATYGKLGAAYASVGDNERAERSFLYALASFSDDATAPFRMEVNRDYGNFLLGVGHAEEALEQFEAGETVARRNDSTVPLMGFLRSKALALSALGRHQEAFASLAAHVEGSERLEHQRGRDVVGILLLELESKLSKEHELSVLTSQVLTETNRTLRVQAQRLERLSNTDELTGLANRRFLNERLAEEVPASYRRGRDVGLVLVDLDDFKKINDTHSHLMGDAVLQRVAALLRSSVRRSDIVARWGGEEFAVLLPGAGKAAACDVAEKVREDVAAAEWGDLAGDLTVTVSAGVACLSDVVMLGARGHDGGELNLGETWLDGRDLYGSLGEPVQELLRLADRRLYAAKEAGRNRIES